MLQLIQGRLVALPTVYEDLIIAGVTNIQHMQGIKIYNLVIASFSHPSIKVILQIDAIEVEGRELWTGMNPIIAANMIGGSINGSIIDNGLNLIYIP